MTAARLVAVVLTLLGLSACGKVAAAPGGDPSPTPVIATPAGGFNVLVTEHDRAVTVHVGDKIEAVLHQKQGMTVWGNLSSDNASVLSPVPTGIMAARGVTIAGFRALKVGSANISASAGPLCSPGAACPMYAVLYSVVVIVTQ